MSLFADLTARGFSPAVAHAAFGLYARVAGAPARCGDTLTVEGFLIETHTLGCRNAADDAEELWWDRHFAIHEEYSTDGASVLWGDPADGVFLTLTPLATTPH